MNRKECRELALATIDLSAFEKTLGYVKNWCKENQCTIGLAEMAVGASLVTWGVQNGVIEIGSKLVATKMGGTNVESMVGMYGGAGAGAIASAVVGSIGIAAGGTAIGIPATVVIGGGALILGAAGYTGGDLIHNFLNQPINFMEFFTDASILAIGVALMIDGGKRIIKDDKVLASLSRFKNGTIYLQKLSTEVIAETIDELKDFMNKFASLPKDKFDVAGSVLGSTGTAAIGLSVGGSIASSSVAVLGSQALGSVALSLGLVSAPIWPVIAGGAIGFGVGYATWKTCKHFGDKIIWDS
ncbi:hypothetical protein ACOHYD_13645 [Desulfobacterota bacterium M19]